MWTPSLGATGRGGLARPVSLDDWCPHSALREYTRALFLLGYSSWRENLEHGQHCNRISRRISATRLRRYKIQISERKELHIRPMIHRRINYLYQGVECDMIIWRETRLRPAFA